MDLLTHSRRPKLALTVACVLGGTISSPGTARASTHSEPPAAAPSEPTAEAPLTGKELARKRVAEGQALYEQAKYEEALVAFQDAAAAYASADFQFNIGLCYERLGETQSAIRAFEAYLRNKPDARDKASVEHRIEELRAELERESRPTPPPATVAPAPATTQPPGPADSGPGVSEDPRPHKPLVIAGSVLAGVGAAVALGGGIGFGLLTRERAGHVDPVLDGSNPDDLTRAQTAALAEEADRFRWGQVGSLAGGGVALVVGAALLTTGLRRRRQSKVAVLPLGRGVAVTGVF